MRLNCSFVVVVVVVVYVVYLLLLLSICLSCSGSTALSGGFNGLQTYTVEVTARGTVFTSIVTMPPGRESYPLIL